jgi:hypothetical protein
LIDFEKEFFDVGAYKDFNLDKLNLKEMLMGVDEEMEHTTNKVIALKITLDHLAKNPNYYSMLKQIEDNQFSKSIEKDASLPVGTTRQHSDGKKYKKVGEGKWQVIEEKPKKEMTSDKFRQKYNETKKQRDQAKNKKDKDVLNQKLLDIVNQYTGKKPK